MKKITLFLLLFISIPILGQTYTSDYTGTQIDSAISLSRPYKTYAAQIVQIGDSTPVFTVFENNLGQNVTYNDMYAPNMLLLQTTAGFPANKTFVSFTEEALAAATITPFQILDTSNILIIKQATNVRYFIEIRVYP